MKQRVGTCGDHVLSLSTEGAQHLLLQSFGLVWRPYETMVGTCADHVLSLSIEGAQHLLSQNVNLV